MNKEKIVRQARRIQEDSLYSEKAHFAMATFWGSLHWILGIPSAVLSATAGLTILEGQTTVAAVCAALATVLTTLLTFLDPKKSAKDRHEAGVQFNTLWNDIGRFIELDFSEDAIPDNARQRIGEFAERKAKLIGASPHTGGLPYWLARISIDRRQHIHEVDRKPE